METFEVAVFSAISRVLWSSTPLLGFVVGVIGGLAALVVFVALGAWKSRQGLKQTLSHLEHHHRTTLAPTVTFAAKIEEVREATRLPVTMCTSPPHPPSEGVPIKLTLVDGLLTITCPYLNSPKRSPTTDDRPRKGPSKEKLRKQMRRATKTLFTPPVSPSTEEEMVPAEEKAEVPATAPPTRVATKAPAVINHRPAKSVASFSAFASVTEATAGSDTLLATFPASKVRTMMADETGHAVLFTATAKQADGCLCALEADPENPGASEVVPISALRVTFSCAREAERWCTILSPTDVTGKWQEFLAALGTKHGSVLNLFLGRLLFDNMGTTYLADLIKAKLKLKLAEMTLPSPVSGSLAVVQIVLGDNIPLFEDATLGGVSPSGEIAFDLNVQYRGGLKIVLCATLDIAVVSLPPLIVTATIAELAGRLHVSISPPPSANLWVAFHEPPHLKIHFEQQVAETGEKTLLRSVVKRMPDLSEIVTELVQKRLFEDMTLPFQEDYPLPNVAPTPTPSPCGSPGPSATSPRVEEDDEEVPISLVRLESDVQTSPDRMERSTAPPSAVVLQSSPTTGGSLPASTPAKQAKSATSQGPPVATKRLGSQFVTFRWAIPLVAVVVFAGVAEHLRVQQIVADDFER